MKDLSFIPTFSSPPGVETISWFKATAVWKMAAKPAKKIAEELEENLEKIFGDDTKI